MTAPTPPGSSSATGGSATPWPRRLRHWRLDIDAPRLLFVAICLFATSIGGIELGVPIPLLHLELALIAPFLLTRTGQAVAVFAICVEILRLVQVPFGFDQIFVSSFLLLRNLVGFPPLYAALTLLAVLVPPLLLYLVLRKLPLRNVRVPVLWATLVLAAVATMLKAEKDYTKINLVGTSFGHVYGQVRFSSMLYGRYHTPGASPDVQPGVAAARIALARHENDWLVLMESGGYPTDPEMRELLYRPFLTEAMKARFDVDIGATPSVGSTIHGEIRQLCDGQLVDGLFGGANQHCLPHWFTAHGYSATAVHANKKAIYSREDWYPKIGFSTIVSSDLPDFPRNGEGGRWGTLDDISAIDWTVAHEFARPDSFVYLLTVSTHLPARLMAGAVVDPRCTARHDSQSCLHLANMQLVLAHVAQAALALPDTVVTLVGDHPPPFVSLSSTSAFDRTKVTRITLIPHVQGPRKDTR